MKKRTWYNPIYIHVIRPLYHKVGGPCIAEGVSYRFLKIHKNEHNLKFFIRPF